MQSTLDRFMSKVKVDDSSGCWEFQNGRDRDGYGTFHRNKKRVQAHRVSYEIFVQPIADGMCICHTCDNPCCVNPCHLFQGTQKDNHRDRERKGRGRRLCGESNTSSKLTEKEVRLIRSFLQRHPNKPGRHSGAVSFLSRWFGVIDNTISSIKNRKSWTHIN